MEYDIFEHYQKLKSNRIQVTYKGMMSQEVLAELGAMIKSSLGEESRVKKIFAVFIEMAQNILHYSAERINDNGVGIVFLNEINNNYYVQSGNMIKKSSIEFVSEKINYVNALTTKEELDNYYKVQLRMPRPEGSKGAGIGFIEIARKTSDRKLLYKIHPINEDYSFITLSAAFQKE